jgi:hypothetical protein
MATYHKKSARQVSAQFWSLVTGGLDSAVSKLDELETVLSAETEKCRELEEVIQALRALAGLIMQAVSSLPRFALSYSSMSLRWGVQGRTDDSCCSQFRVEWVLFTQVNHLLFDLGYSNVCLDIRPKSTRRLSSFKLVFWQHLPSGLIDNS